MATLAEQLTRLRKQQKEIEEWFQGGVSTEYAKNLLARYTGIEEQLQHVYIKQFSPQAKEMFYSIHHLHSTNSDGFTAALSQQLRWFANQILLRALPDLSEVQRQQLLESFEDLPLPSTASKERT